MKTFIKFGLITGMLVGCWNLSCFTAVSWLNHALSLGIPAARLRAYSGLFGVVILVLGIYLGMRAAKARNGGLLPYGQAVGTGVAISVITAIMVGIFALLYCTVINPGYTDFMVKDAEAALVAARKTPAEIAEQLAQVRQQFSTAWQVMQALVAQSVVGTISSLIIGLFVRKRK